MPVVEMDALRLEEIALTAEEVAEDDTLGALFHAPKFLAEALAHELVGWDVRDYAKLPHQLRALYHDGQALLERPVRTLCAAAITENLSPSDFVARAVSLAEALQETFAPLRRQAREFRHIQEVDDIVEADEAGSIVLLRPVVEVIPPESV